MEFMILANPRSRTKWIADYLSSYGARVGHDEALGCSSVEEYVSKVYCLDGVVETSTALGYKLWLNEFPRAKMIVIYRPIIEVADSLSRAGLVPDWTFLYLQKLMLDRLIIDYSVPFFTYAGLNRVEQRKGLCMQTVREFDKWKDESWKDTKIEIDIAARVEFLKKNPLVFHSFCSDIVRKLIPLEHVV